MDALQEAWAEQRNAREDELKRSLAEICQQVQNKSRGAESRIFLYSTKTMIEQLEVNIDKVMGESSHTARLPAATLS